ncbi:MAG: hypothetical protein LBT00_16290 [Spirochaetaceae bacterium]|nr:hypothetical protein [Spirochaetaceae bacterium]
MARFKTAGLKHGRREASRLDCFAPLAMTGDTLVMTGITLAMTGRRLSLRAAKRRSNPDGRGPHTGLLRSARNDRRDARNDRRAMTGRGLSLRAAKRRSNPDGEGPHTGLLRSALTNDTLAMTGAQ